MSWFFGDLRVLFLQRSVWQRKYLYLHYAMHQNRNDVRFFLRNNWPQRALDVMCLQVIGRLNGCHNKKLVHWASWHVQYILRFEDKTAIVFKDSQCWFWKLWKVRNICDILITLVLAWHLNYSLNFAWTTTQPVRFIVVPNLVLLSTFSSSSQLKPVGGHRA